MSVLYSVIPLGHADEPPAWLASFGIVRPPGESRYSTPYSMPHEVCQILDA